MSKIPFPNPKIMQSKNTNTLLCGTKCTKIALNIVKMTDITILVNFVNLLIREMKNINNAPRVDRNIMVMIIFDELNSFRKSAREFGLMPKRRLKNPFSCIRSHLEDLFITWGQEQVLILPREAVKRNFSPLRC